MNFLKKLFKPTPTLTSTLQVTSSNGFHLRPIAKFVNEAKQFEATITLLSKQKEVSATQVPQILSLSLEKGDNFTLKCKGKEAQKALTFLSSYFEELMRDDKEITEIVQEKSEYTSESIKGTTISKGTGVGILTSYYRETIYNENGLSLKEALEKTANELDELYKNNKEKEEAEIFLAHKSLLESELFQKEFDHIDRAIERLKGGKFESRIADYKDIKKRIESKMGKERIYRLPDDETSSILVVDMIGDELLPSEVEELSRLKNLKGVILEYGSTTSHVAILLRSFKIPAIIIQERITPTGELFYSILDANAGQLIDLPTQEELDLAERKILEEKKEEEKSHQNRFEKTETKAGKKIKVLANITNLESAKEAKELGADGVGLLRTEFLFTKEKPTIEEQTKTYTEIFKLFDEVTVRTLDIGGDKSLPYINIPKEDNPFLGLRGIRFSLQEETLLKEQLLAIFKAVGVTMSHVKIMFPMISNIQEFQQAKTIALEIAKANNLDLTNIQFGIMLEVPSVIFALKEFDSLVDFYSIGSNDLTQYLFAIERTHPTLSVDATSPELMNALAYIKTQTQKPISICGELAGLEEATQQLVEMGYETLSVSAKLIPYMKESIRNI